MSISSLITFLGKQRVYLCLKQDQIYYRSSVSIPEPYQKLLKNYKSLLINSLKPYKDTDVLISPLSFNQQSLWFSYLMAPESNSYHVAVPMRIFYPVDPLRIHKTLASLTSCHDQLRATFVSFSDEKVSVPCQLIPEKQTHEFLLYDVTGLTDNQIKEEVQNFYNTPFKLSEAPALRTGLFSRSSTEHILIFLFHHIICDAQSIGIFLENFHKHFINENVISSDPATYTDFITYQADYLQEHQHALLDYWKSRSSCERGRPLVTDFGRKEVRSNKGKSVFFHIGKETRQRVISLASRLSITPFSVYLGCFQLFYMIRSKSLNSTIGVLSSGRSDRKFLQTIGYFINPLPIFSQCQENTSLKDHFKATHRSVCELLDNQNYPFSLLVKNISVERKANEPVLFSAVFNMLSNRKLGLAANLVYSDDNEQSQLSFCEMPIKSYPLNQQEGQFDLTVELIDLEDDGIRGILKYDSDLFSVDTAEKFVSFYKGILNEVLLCLDRTVSDLFSKIDMSAKGEKDGWHLTVASTFTANMLQESFQFWQNVTGVHISCDFSPYLHIEQSLGEISMKGLRQEGYLIILLRLEDLGYWRESEFEIDLEYIRVRAWDLAKIIISTAAERRSRLIVIFCPPSSVVKQDPVLCAGLQELEMSMILQLNEEKHVYCICSEKLMNSFDSGICYESSVGIVGQVPYTEYFYEFLGMIIIRTVHGFEKLPCKAIILDCDNTLWGGVAGEDPISQITITEEFREFQQFLRKCKEAGIVLCLCSKNNREDVVAVFEKHPDMVLKLSDITFERINWQSKSQNIAEICAEANLTSSGVVFIDDNPAECAEVSANCPDITVIHLPESLSERNKYIKNFWAFDTLKVTAEDLSRIEKYRTEKFRADLRNQSSSFAEFIKGLNLQVTIRSAAENDISRISQLSYRTNQFTTGSGGLSESQIYDDLKSHEIFVVEVTDRFGDYGLVGVIRGHKAEDTYLVDSFFLSCRSLGRGVEYRCLSFIGDHAETLGCSQVSIELRRTARNQPIQLFFGNTLSLYQNSDGSLLSYRVPCGVLRQVCINPDETGSHSVFNHGQQSEADSVSERFSISGQILDRIARQYSNIEFLHLQILSMRKLRYSNETAIDVNDADAFDSSANADLQRVLKKIWADSLGRDSIDVHQNFFDAGGSSILLPHIVQKIQQYLKKDVTLVELFQYPTIFLLASHLGRKESDKESSKQKVVLQNDAYGKFRSRKAL
jgi:FkbH-like protein